MIGKKTILKLIIWGFAFGVMTSCQEDTEVEYSKGYIQFAIKSTAVENGRLTVTEPAAILISVKDEQENLIHNLKKIQLYKVGNQYITEAVEFVEGNFTVEDFIVVDDQDEAIYISPKAGSVFEKLVSMALPLEFNVSGQNTIDLTLEVIPSNLGEIVEYGYSSISFQVVNTLEKGLVAYYSFDGDAHDKSGNEMHASVDGPVLVNDRFDHEKQAFFFDVQDDKITGSTDPLGISDTFTISCWIITEDNSLPHLVSKYDWTVDKGYTLRLMEGVPYLDGRDGNGEFIRVGESSTQVNNSQWHHLLAVVIRSQWALFVDGEIISKYESQSESVDFSTEVPLSLGYYFRGNEGDYRFFNGTLDEVRIYNRALTLFEISKLAGEMI